MKTKFKFILSFAAGLFFSSQLMAQQVQINRVDITGNPNTDKYKNVNGSPFLFADWAMGSAKTVDGAEKKDILLKYDEITDMVMMKGEADVILTFSVPVTEFTIHDNKTNTRIFRNGFAATKVNTEASFFEVLADGKVKLLKKNHKIINESKEYSGAINKTVVDVNKYYLVTENNTPVLIKLDQKSINTLLPNKQTELTEYAKANKLNVKDQADAAKLIAYYNSL